MTGTNFSASGASRSRIARHFNATASIGALAFMAVGLAACGGDDQTASSGAASSPDAMETARPINASQPAKADMSPATNSNGNESFLAGADIDHGAALYQEGCVACHGSNLRGTVGFNLVDGEWIHGSSPDQIVANVKSGFPEKGMTAFDTIYSDDEIKDIVAYVLSRREGWESVNYRIWPEPSDANPEGPFDFASVMSTEASKHGEFTPPQADFGMPELQNYVMAVDGKAHIPPGAPRALWIASGGNGKIQVSVDGEIVSPQYDMGGTIYPMPNGVHDVSIAYTTTGSPDWFPKDLIITGVDMSKGARDYPMSEAGRRFLENTSFQVKAVDHPRIVRRPVKNMPPSTISVGLPEGVNYGFNTKTCEIVGVWKGDFLDIGPNIDGRGQAPAFPIGDWIFHSPDHVSLGGEDAQCTYDGMTTSDSGAPTFQYAIANNTYSVTGDANSEGGIVFTYRSVSGGAVPAVRLANVNAKMAEQNGSRMITIMNGEAE